MRNRGCLSRIGCLIVLLLIVLIVIYFIMQGSFSFFSTRGAADDADATAGASSDGAVPTTAGQLIFRLIWQGDQIFYNGNQIDEQRFVEIIREAKELAGRVECEKASAVAVETETRRRRLMDEIGVAYHGC